MSKTISISRRHSTKISVGIKTFVGICFIFPVIIACIFSFVPNEELYGVPSIATIFETATLENYQWIFNNIPIFRYVSNSLVQCVIIIIAHTILGCLAAYAFAFFKFKGKDTIFQIVLIAMMVPGEVCTICNFLTVRNMGLVNTFLGLTVVSFVSCHAIFMLRQSYLTIPKEIKEATMMDGCGELRFLFKFAIPMSIPTICSLAITTFISVFNSYLWPLLISRSPDKYTVQIGMALLVTQEVPTYGRSMAGAVLCMFFPVVIFIIFQSYMIKGLVSGAVKG